jgi:hypothetical protein
MTAILNPSEDSTALESSRPVQFRSSPIVDVEYRLRAHFRAVSCKIERHFASFADVPYHDPLSRQQWERLWETATC